MRKNKEASYSRYHLADGWLLNITLLLCNHRALCGLLTWDSSGHLFVVII